MDEEKEENHIREFRYIIQKIKKSIIQNKTLESQNISDLKTILEPELNKLFLLLRPIIEQYKPSNIKFTRIGIRIKLNNIFMEKELSIIKLIEN